MEPVARLIARFGRFAILFGFLFLILLLYFEHFGFAEKFANYFLLLAIVVVLVQMLMIKGKYSAQSRQGIFNGFSLFGWLGIAAATFLVFRPIFSIGPAVWGDAPYFYPEAFKDFFWEPFAWESRGRLGVAIDLYWIYPLMLLYRGLGALGLNNDLIIRLVFYFPAIVFAFLSPLLFTRYLGFPPLVSLFAVLIYVLNTYFILLVDGGQVGVALAYGLFPFALLQLYKLAKEQTKLQFFTSIFIFMLLVIADVRLALIAIFTVVVLVGLEHITNFRKIKRQNFWRFVLFCIAFVLLSSYWLLPVVLVPPTTGAATRTALNLISVLNPLFLFQPHWPLNEFGKISSPSWLFGGTLMLILANLFFKSTRRIFLFLFCFLFFVFLTKGDIGLLGGIYAWIVDTIPLGGAFRDSTKFFAPLFLFAGILVGSSIQNLTEFFGKHVFSKAIVLLVCIYFLFLVHPAIFGNMRGVLAGRSLSKDMEIIKDKVIAEEGFVRTVWFPDPHPFGFHTEGKPVLAATKLVDLRPLASLNVGTTDIFNFLHNRQFLQWLDIFGVKYLVFSGDTRKVLPNKEKEEDWQNLLDLVGSIKGLDKVEWGTSFPVYQTQSNKPRVFAVDKAVVVVGSDDIYQRLIDNNEAFSIGNQGFVFLEDGKLDPRNLEEVASSSAVIVFNQKEKSDLILSFLSKFFVIPVDNNGTQWAIRTPDEYLKWKFELLVNKIETTEFDYGKGIAFSSQPNEKLVFALDADQEGEYVLAIRHMSRPSSSPLHLTFDGQTEEIPTTGVNRFEWYTKETKLARGKYDLVLENPNGFQVVNVVALIPKADWESANALTDQMLAKFPIAGIDDTFSLGDWKEVTYRMISPVEYTVAIPPEVNWLVFSDTYNPEWVFRSGGDYTQSYPFYSAINGFNVSGMQEGGIIFNGQKYVRLGIYLSLASLLFLATLFVWAYSRSRRK